jgi:anti-sigma factor RsiW
VPERTLWQNAQTMEIAYELTQNDFTEAFAVHRQRKSAAKVLPVVVFWMGIAFASYVLYGAVRADDTMRLLPLSFIVILWIIVVEIFPRWNVRRQFTNQPGAHGPRKLMLDASGAHWRWNGGSSDVEWRNYIRSTEGANQIQLYTSPSCFNILPKRAVNQDQLAELRALLAQNIRAEQ